MKNGIFQFLTLLCLMFTFIVGQAQESDSLQLAKEEALEQVVVIGYGTVKKKDATGAVDLITSEDFNKGVTTSPDQLLQGRVAGVQITSSSGEPGAGSAIRIRGASSIRSGNGPLIVVDGVPLSGENVSANADVGIGTTASRNPLNFLNSSDIESMSVLKDASATAIYGSRGANGVIIITTKRGKKGEGRLSLDASTTWGVVSKKLDLLTADDFATWNSAKDGGARLDPFDEITRTAFTQQYNVSYSGGSDTGAYRVSLGMLDQEGVIKNSALDKYSFNANVRQSFFDKIWTVESSVMTSFINDNGVAISDNVGAEGDLLTSALKWNPTSNLIDSNGDFVQPSDNQRNPLAFLNYYTDKTETIRVLGDIKNTIKITEGLEYKFNFGIDYSNSQRKIAISRLMNINGILGRGRANIQDINAFNLLFEHTLNYKKSFGIVDMNALVGYSYQRFDIHGEKFSYRDFTVNDQGLYIQNIKSGASFTPENTNDNISNTTPIVKLQSYFARAEFDIANKYLLTGTIRADGSSKFGSGNKYGYFPAVAAAWKISSEEFMSSSFFNDLKLRIGWGLTGNQEFPAGAAQTQFDFVRVTDSNGNLVSVPTQTTVGNPDLKWETTQQINAGLDFAFLKKRITGSIDYFQKDTKDLLFRFLADFAPAGAYIWRNLEDLKVKSNGIEVALNGIIIDKEDLTFDLGFNIAFLKNKVTGVSDAGFPAGINTGSIAGSGLSGEYIQKIYDDEPLYAYYLPVFEGFDSKGYAIYKDINGDGKIDTSQGAPGTVDREFSGSPNPDITIGINANLRYKNWDLSAYFYGAYGHQVYNNTANVLFNTSTFVAGENVTYDIVNAPLTSVSDPTTDDPNRTTLIASNGEGNRNALSVSTRYLESGDFLRLANLTLGYTFQGGAEAGFISWVKSLRLYITASNLFVITPYSGFDPEVNKDKSIDGVPSFGIDYSAYPRNRAFTIGINLNF